MRLCYFSLIKNCSISIFQRRTNMEIKIIDDLWKVMVAASNVVRIFITMPDNTRQQKGHPKSGGFFTIINKNNGNPLVFQAGLIKPEEFKKNFILSHDRAVRLQHGFIPMGSPVAVSSKDHILSFAGFFPEADQAISLVTAVRIVMINQNYAGKIAQNSDNGIYNRLIVHATPIKMLTDATC